MNKWMSNDVIKLVAIGPESTGKSTLCQSLADHFSTLWCKEYARQYLTTYGTDYSYHDLLKIAEGQIQNEDSAIEACIHEWEKKSTSNPPVLIIDTDMYVMKVWSEFFFGKCHPFILKNIVERKYDGYFLCSPDLPWTQDELREYPDYDTREKLFCCYKDILINQSVPWFEVKGEDPTRTQSAMEWASTRFSKS
jgi:NadR type nicotinamide-nucleotide adenylyltransferase